MAREYFKNEPDETTPLEGERFNGFFNGEESLEKLAVGDIECKNLFTGLVKGVDIASNTGAESTSPTSATSDFIPVDMSNSRITISGMTSEIADFIAAYNSNKQFLGRTGGSHTASRTLKADSFTSGTPQGTGDIAYLRVKMYLSSGDTATIDVIDNLQIQLEYGNDATPYAEHKEFDSRAYLLWRNLAPTSEFAGQQVSLSDNIRNYKYYEIIYKIYSNSNYHKSTGKIPTLNNTLLSNSHIYNERRYVKISTETEISFENAVRYSSYGSSSTTTANTLLIPVEILAYK